MLTLLHHPICPHSRFIRLIAEEYSLPLRLIEERTWERRAEFLALNPNGTTPVLIEEGAPPVPGAAIIAEYLDETRGAAFTPNRLFPEDPNGRVEVRRLMEWFNGKFFEEVSGALVTERVYKRYTPAGNGGRAPDTETLRAAKSNIKYHLAYIGWLVRTRDWLAADYLGDVPWDEDETAKNWYARIKSRPSFRTLLAETMPGLPPSASYANLDF
jgi:glutathione S-transferase